MKTNSTQLFCVKYWNRKANLSKTSSQNCTVKGNIYGINVGCLLNDKVELRSCHEISRIDNDFKHLKPLENDIVLWRGVPKYNPLHRRYLDIMYKKIESLNKGDIFVSPSYLFGAFDKNIADSFRFNFLEEGLIMKLNIPKGSKVSRSSFEGIMPRYSKWICINKEELKDGFLIELDYIIPENKKQNYFAKEIKKLTKVIKNILKQTKV